MRPFLLRLGVISSLSLSAGCTVVAVTGAAASGVVAVTGAAVKTTGAAVGAVIPDGKKKEQAEKGKKEE